jgi:hypothetical protein
MGRGAMWRQRWAAVRGCAHARPSSTMAPVTAVQHLAPLLHACVCGRACRYGLNLLQGSARESDSGGGGGGGVQAGEPGSGGLTAAISRAMVGALSAALHAREGGANVADSIFSRLNLGGSPGVPTPVAGHDVDAGTSAAGNILHLAAASGCCCHAPILSPIVCTGTLSVRL